MLPEQPARFEVLRDKVLAADARKAGSESDATRYDRQRTSVGYRTPRAPGGHYTQSTVADAKL